MHLPIAICRNKNLHKFENRLLHITCQLQLAPFIKSMINPLLDFLVETVHHLSMDGRELVTVNQDSKIQDKRTPGSGNYRGFSCFNGFVSRYNSLLGPIIAYAIIDCNMQK